jgi:hypothetical protein
VKGLSMGKDEKDNDNKGNLIIPLKYDIVYATLVPVILKTEKFLSTTE